MWIDKKKIEMSKCKSFLVEEQLKKEKEKQQQKIKEKQTNKQKQSPPTKSFFSKFNKYEKRKYVPVSMRCLKSQKFCRLSPTL